MSFVPKECDSHSSLQIIHCYILLKMKDRIFVNKSQFKIVQAGMNTKHEV